MARSSRLTLRVLDESGNTISGAHVRAFFSVDEGRGPDPNYRQHDGITSKDGIYSVSDRCDNGIGFDVTKEGYYESGANEISIHVRDGDFGWKRIDPMVDVFMVKIGAPIPMYARHFDWDLKIPECGKPLGFDLLMADWVEPFGGGSRADLYFNIEKQLSTSGEFYESKLTVTFPNEEDGFAVEQELPRRAAPSVFRSARTAPESGYESRYEKSAWRRPGTSYENDFDDNRNYCMRIRSRVENGKVVDAIYGKLKGDIRFDVRESDTAVLCFTYYINPTPNSRNVEFDPKQNLFKNLKDNERVVAP